MPTEQTEDTMHKRETIMEDGKRKLYYFTFGDEGATPEPADESHDANSAKEASNNE
ncbi:MAG TPA: hypothetical protein VGK19_08335 [Capsulimonadaceae bacterium]|jgi:hypothetical protein